MSRWLLSVGHGYSARAFAASLPEGWRVRATARTPERAAELRAAGAEPVSWEDDVALADAAASAEAVLVSVPPRATGDIVLPRIGGALAASTRLRWLGYLSATGVYGDRQGGWVDETAARAPVTERGHWRVLAEDAWCATGLPVHVFRLAGIYGPGRSALDRIREGRAQRVMKPGQVFSRIHVDDIAAVLRRSLERPRPGRAYNVADDLPAPPQDVLTFAAGLLGLPPPPEVPFDTADLSPMARSFYSESKRIANRRIREELGVDLAYPDYRAGLRAILAAGG